MRHGRAEKPILYGLFEPESPAPARQGHYFEEPAGILPVTCPLLAANFDFYYRGVSQRDNSGTSPAGTGVCRSALVPCALSAPWFVLRVGPGPEALLQHDFEREKHVMRVQFARQQSAARIDRASLPRHGGRRLAIAAVVLTAALSVSQRAMAQMGPLAMNDYGMTMEDQPTVIKILGNDYDMSAPLNLSSVTIVTYPLNGWIVVSPTTGNVLYTPDDDFYGTDGFQYTVSDVNGRVSNVASVMIAVTETTSAPVITSFNATYAGNNQWHFSGMVNDAELAGNLITFGGLISGSTTTRADGSFSYQATLPPATQGYVTAQATNDENLTSTIDDVYVFNN
jgi:hypothetical protein